MKILQLPPVLLAFLVESVLATEATTGVPATGSGSEYANSCAAAITGWVASSKAWAKAHQKLSTTTQGIGGTRLSTYTVYENATTLCDGHARVTYSPAKSIGLTTKTLAGSVTGTTTIVGTYVSPAWDPPYPTCRISPTDCDHLWSTYHSQVLAAATITPGPATPIATPPCANQTAASQDATFQSSLHGCGKCTIYGDGVELVYFPTSASRDMCATTPTDPVTHYGKGAVITAYAGTNYKEPGPANGAQTAVVDSHTFTSGTAYISIRRVSAVDRCTRTFGPVVSNAILAMPSESVLSLRYRQDHFQLLQETDTQTGYPVSYADFNNPVPFSAWIGQQKCDIGIDETMCGIIYENDFRPQLAIPPEITQLSPDFEGCQMWYNGLWDPPLALTEYSEAANPTVPHGYQPTTAPVPASPSSAIVALTITATGTALANELQSSHPAQGSYGVGGSPMSPHAGEHSDGPGHGGAGNGSSSGYIETSVPASGLDSQSHLEVSDSSADAIASGTDRFSLQSGATETQPSMTSTTASQATGGAMGFVSTMHSSLALAIFVLALVAA